MRSLLLVTLSILSAAAAARDFSGLVSVNDDGSLRVGRHSVHLAGIHIPSTDETCLTFIRPVMCGERAVLQLRLKARGFVECTPVAERADGSLEARCRLDAGPLSEGDDLAEYMLRNGWALARPDAPFEYHALERIARHHDRGIWGIALRP